VLNLCELNEACYSKNPRVGVFGFIHLFNMKSKEESVKRQVLIIFAVTMIVFCFSSSGALALSDKCIVWGYKWWDQTDYIYTYTWLYSDGSFATDEGHSGNWEKFGGAFMLQYTDGCMPLYSGTKKQGYFECTSGSGPTGPNYYTIKGTNKKNCEAAIPVEGVSSVKGGPSGASPE